MNFEFKTGETCVAPKVTLTKSKNLKYNTGQKCMKCRTTLITVTFFDSKWKLN
jgi:hypothetical protein